MVLAVFVVGLHTSVLAEYSPQLSFFLVNGLFRVAVPIFFIINGFFLARLIDDPARFASWARHLFGMYAIWMLVFLPFYLPVNGTFYEWRVFCATLATGYFHLWYLIAVPLAGLLLYKVRHCGTVLLLGVAMLLFLCGAAWQYISLYGNPEHPLLERLAPYEWTWRNFLFFGLPFMTAGYLAAREDWRHKISGTALAILLAVGALLMLGEVSLAYSMGDRKIDMLLTLVIVCPAIFLAVARLQFSGDGRRLALLSTGVYLIHPLPLLLLAPHVHAHRTVLFALCLAAALAAAHLLSKSKPWLRWAI
ncbi:hypothetical protein ASF44_15235 [Pseudorhodoferax sp. Leaf274]|nr:hypothetical protein ASF44_15235 [Pseudorhodoferax sp. Leaf274]